MPIFDTPINGQHGFVIPCLALSLSGEEIPVILVAARPDHRIDARPASEHPPHVEGQSTAIESRVGLRLEVPLSFRPKAHGPPSRVHDLRNVIPPARFQQQHADVRIFGQTARDDRSGRTRTADDKVVLLL
jgi:hypothetical protein